MRKQRSRASILIVVLVGIWGYLSFNPERWFPDRNPAQGKETGKAIKQGNGEGLAPEYCYSIDCKDRSPRGIACALGRLYVSYAGVNKIDILDYEGKRLDSFSSHPGGASNIVALASDSSRNIYAVDETSRVILVFDRYNRFLYPFPPRKMNPSDADFLHIPAGVSTHRQLVFVADIGSRSVKSYLNNGDFMLALKGPDERGEEPWHPANVAVCEDGRVLVSDVLAKNVAVFNCAGKFAHFFEDAGDEKKLSAPGAMAIDGKGRVHVVDNHTRKVFVYDNYGRFLFTYGGPGEEGFQTLLPGGLAIDTGRSLIFIADSGNHQIDVWEY